MAASCSQIVAESGTPILGALWQASGPPTKMLCHHRYTDKKETQIFLIYQVIQNGAVAKWYMTNGLLIYGEIFAHFLIY
jgi:hypothetical protein